MQMAQRPQELVFGQSVAGHHVVQLSIARNDVREQSSVIYRFHNGFHVVHASDICEYVRRGAEFRASRVEQECITKATGRARSRNVRARND